MDAWIEKAIETVTKDFAIQSVPAPIVLGNLTDAEQNQIVGLACVAKNQPERSSQQTRALAVVWLERSRQDSREWRPVQAKLSGGDGSPFKTFTLACFGYKNKWVALGTTLKEDVTSITLNLPTKGEIVIPVINGGFMMQIGELPMPLKATTFNTNEQVIEQVELR